MLDRWTRGYEDASKFADKTSMPDDPAQRKAEGWFDLRHEMLRTTMDVICQVGFGRDYEEGMEKEYLLLQEKETFTAPSLKKMLDETNKEGGEPLYRTFNEILSKMAGRSRMIPLFYRFTVSLERANLGQNGADISLPCFLTRTTT